MILLINKLPCVGIHRILIADEFNLDQILFEHVAKFDPPIQPLIVAKFDPQYSTHVPGEILDLVFDTSCSSTFFAVTLL